MNVLGRLSLAVRSLHTASTARNGSRASTVNASEVTHFSRLSSLWWDEQGEFALLHRMNPVRMQFIREKLVEIWRDEHAEGGGAPDGSPLQGLSVLDVGCGGGLLSESLARVGAKTLGIDASESNIAVATLHASLDHKLSSSDPPNKPILTYRHMSAESLLEEPERFDVVCSMEVLEHVDNPARFLSVCADLVKPGGHLFLSTIARTPLAYMLTILAAEQLFRKVTPGTHTFSKYVNPSELISFFRKYPFSSEPDGPASSVQASRPWITRTYDHGLPARTEAEVRGIVYIPWKGEWVLMPRWSSAWGTVECNYMFWARKPQN